MPCYVNLPLRWLHEQPLWADWFVNGRVAPEFGLDAGALSMPGSWHKDMAARFRDAGIVCAVHLPFMGVDPCDLDGARAATARDTLKRAAELSAVYGAKHMIGHPYHRPRKDGREADDTAGRWMDLSLLAWPGLPDIAGSTLFLENTYEKTPGALTALIGALHAQRPGADIGVCFDVGHWHCFAGCRTVEELLPWLDAFAPFALHLHLHDNDGTVDQHVGMGKGTVPLAELFEILSRRGKTITATMEPHDAEAFSVSIDWLDVHPAAAAAMDWEKPRMEALPFGEMQKNIPG